MQNTKTSSYYERTLPTYLIDLLLFWTVLSDSELLKRPNYTWSETEVSLFPEMYIFYNFSP